MSPNPTSKQEFLDLSRENLLGARGLISNETADPRGRNAGKLICQSVEHSLKALICIQGDTPRADIIWPRCITNR